MTAQCEITAKRTSGAPIGVFERYLTLWVFACILAGIALGHLVPPVFEATAALEVAQINLPVAVLIWLMIIPMLLKVDLTALSGVRQHWRGAAVTLFVNWAVKPFSMALLAWLFVEWLFRPYLPAEQIDYYVAGMIILGAAPCTAMVFVWSNLSRGEPNFTLTQVALNDVIMIFAFGPIVGLLLGLTAIVVPWATLFLSVLLYIIVPLAIATLWRALLLRGDPGGGSLARVLAALHPISLLALLATLVLLFGFQGEQITNQPGVIGLLAVPLLIQTFLIFILAYLLNRWVRSPHAIAGPSALIGTSNFFELAVATAIALFGFESGAALATVVGVLIEVPVMLLLVRIVLRTQGWYERRAGIPVATGGVPALAARSASAVLTVDARVGPARVAILTAPVAGRILACVVRPGDAVSAGQELLRIDPPAAIGAAADPAPEAGVGVRAPWSGRVWRVHPVAEGVEVPAGAPLLELFSGLVLQLVLGETHALALAPGQQVQARLAAAGAPALALTVTRAWPELDPEQGTRRFEVDLPAELDLAVGMHAQVEVPLAAPATALPTWPMPASEPGAAVAPCAS